MTDPSPPKITDRAALLRFRQRTRHLGRDLFLHQEAAAEIEERLIEVNRSFTSPALISDFPEPFAEILPDAMHVADDEVLDLQEGAHDLIVHAMCLHWSNDPVGQLVQCRRALRPDGLLLAVMMGGQTLHELRSSLAQAESELTGGLSPRVLPMAEIRDLGGLLQRAGFALPVADTVKRTASFANPFKLMVDLRKMGANNALAARNHKIPPRAFFPRACTIYAHNFPAEESRVRATFEMIFLTGWAPDDSQPRPLRPGSASHRLAEALGTTEIPSGEAPG